MIGTVNNGRRAEVTFGPYAGPAGVQDMGGETRVAFFSAFNQMKAVATGEIDGLLYTVISVSRSDMVKGMVVLTVTAVTADPA